MTTKYTEKPNHKHDCEVVQLGEFTRNDSCVYLGTGISARADDDRTFDFYFHPSQHCLIVRYGEDGEYSSWTIREPRDRQFLTAPLEECLRRVEEAGLI